MPNTKIARTIEEIIIITAAIMALVTLIPFAIFRFSQGQYLIAILEVIAVIAISCVSYYVWKTRNTELPGFILSFFVLTGVVGLNYMIGPSIIFWIYPTIIGTYFLHSAKISTLLVIVSLVALTPLLLMEKNPIGFANILVTMIITQVFSYIITSRIRQQHARLENLTDHDGLTGALNRRSLDDRLDLLQNLYFRHKRSGGNITSVIVFNIDNFKMINDDLGSIEGDKILIRLTKAIQGYIRKTDELYRYGGEEFVLVANGANLLKAAELAEKIRTLIESSQLSNKATVTASFGVAEVQNLEKSSKWISRASDALYRAKRAGKNRVFLANAEQINYPFIDKRASQ